MRKSFFLVSLVTVCLISCSQDYDSNTTTTSITTSNEPSDEIEAPYVTTNNFDEWVLQSDKPVLVDFTAEWCIPCKLVDPVIDSLTSEFEGRASVLKLDIDISPEIYTNYKVNGIPHILFFNHGIEEERISSPQDRAVYVDYLEAMIDGESAKSVTYQMLDQDEFRRHFILSRDLDVIKTAMNVKPLLLKKNFENGLTPLSLILNFSSVRQNDLIDLALSQEPNISVQDLVALGRCEEFREAVLADPEAVDRPDPDGNTPIITALMRAHRLAEKNCVRTVLEAGPTLDKQSEGTRSLNRAVILMDDDLILQEFLDSGWDPTMMDESGQNALHWAAVYGYESKIRTLLEFGMDPMVENSDGETAGDTLSRVVSRREQIIESERANMDKNTLNEMEAELQRFKDLITMLENSSVEQN